MNRLTAQIFAQVEAARLELTGEHWLLKKELIEIKKRIEICNTTRSMEKKESLTSPN